MLNPITKRIRMILNISVNFTRMFDYAIRVTIKMLASLLRRKNANIMEAASTSLAPSFCR